MAYTKSELKEIVKNKTLSSYINHYKGVRGTLLVMRCHCGEVFEVALSKVNTNKNRKPKRECNACSLSKRGKSQMITDSEYQQRKKDLGIEIRNLEKPKGRGVGIYHVCPICNSDKWKPTPANILSKKSTKCLECSMNNKVSYNKKNDDEYQEDKKSRGIDVVNIEPYKGYSIKIKHICPKCGGDWLVSPAGVLNSKTLRCESCSYSYRGKLSKLSNKEVNERIEERGCEWVEGVYSGKDSKLTYKCSCGNLFTRIFNDFQNNMHRCEKCAKSISVGELKIKEWLESKGVRYTHQRKFDDLRGLRNMPYFYDFSIDDNNGEPIALIEYDGAFHFKPMYEFYKTKKEAEDEFKKTKARDKKKNEYAKTRNIPLIRLNGKDYLNLEEHLNMLIPR